jgi:uncharacterized protein (TIGR02246 family)
MSTLLFVAGCAQTSSAPSVDLAAEEAKIRELEETHMKNFASKDMDKIMAFYADDATFITTGGPALKGKDAIRKGLAGMVADPNLNLQFKADRVDVGKSGDVAFTQGSYQLTVSDAKTKKPLNDKGSYVTTYRKQADGSWKAVSDVAVSELPPGGAS